MKKTAAPAPPAKKPPLRRVIVEQPKEIYRPPKNAPRIHGVADVISDGMNLLSRARVFGMATQVETTQTNLPIPDRTFELRTEISKKQILAERGLGQRPPLKEVIFHVLLSARGGLKVSEIVLRAKEVYARLQREWPQVQQDEHHYVYELLKSDDYYGFQEV